MLHETAVGSNMDALGCPTGPPNIFNEPDRAMLLAFLGRSEGVVRQGRCSGHVLEIVVGHSTGLLMGLVTSWLGHWDLEVIATDASSRDGGITAASWFLEEVQRCGRIHERWRLRVADAVDVRRDASSQARIDVTSLLPSNCWCLDEDFEEVPAQLLTSRWQREQGWNRWRYLNSTGALEAWALLHRLKSPSATHAHHSSLTEVQRRNCPSRRDLSPRDSHQTRRAGTAGFQRQPRTTSRLPQVCQLRGEEP